MIFKKIIQTFIFSTILVITSFAQKNSIKGYIIDSISKTPLAYSTIRIFEKQNSKLFISTLTDTSGKFTLQNIPFSEYVCQINYLGYTQKKVLFTLDKDNKSIDFKYLELSPSNTNLNEVVIKDQAKTTTKIDRIIYKVDSTDIANAVTSLDVMKKVPDIKVDLINNSVGIKGNGSSLILINGVNREGQIDIRSINPKDIDRIEVISSPSSGVDSDIDGIINIILKEKPVGGYNILIACDYVPYKKSIEPYITMVYGWKKIRFNVDYFYGLKGYHREETIYRKNLTDNNVYESFNNINNPNESHQNFKTSLDYYIDKSNFLNFSTENRISDVNSKYICTSKNTLNDSLLYSTATEAINNSDYFLGNYTVFYKKNFMKEGQEFTSNINFHYMKADYEVKYNDELRSTIDTTKLFRYNSQIGDKTSYNIKLEYIHPINDNLKFTTGVLSYLSFFKDKFNTEIVSEQSEYGNLRYNYYLDMYFRVKKFDFRVGGKIENYNTFINNSTNVNQTKLLPSIIISKKIKNRNTIKLNYRAIAFYPSVWDLTPNIIYKDSLNATQGNPNLKPQTLNKAEINHTYRKGDIFFSTSLYYTEVQNMITYLNYINDSNFNLKKAENIEGKREVGINISSSVLFFEKFQMEPNIKIFNESFNNDFNQKSNISTICSFSANYNLPKGFFVGISSSYHGKILTTQGYIEPQHLIDYVYVRKKLFKGDGDITVGYINPFFQRIDKYIIEINNIYQTQTNTGNFQSFLIKFNYNLTKSKEYEMKRIEKIMDRDVK